VLIADSEAKLTEAARSHVASLEARINALDDLRARGDAEVQQLPAVESEEERLMLRVASLGRMADQVRSELQQARMSEAVEVGQIEIVHLAPHSVPAESKRLMKLFLAAMLGLVLGGTTAFAAEAANTSIRRPQDVASMLRVPRLAVIPRIEKPKRRRLWVGDVVAAGPGGNGAKLKGAATGARSVPEIGMEAVDAYRTLRANLTFSSRLDSFRTLMVTSASPQEGKTTTISNLAVSFARQGLRVLLVDGDLRGPRLHQVFQAAQEPGLSSVLEGRHTVAEVAQPIAVAGLQLITSGERPVDPSELLSGEKMRAFLRQCREQYDLVLVDTPPVLAAAETAMLAGEVDAVLVVVRAGQTDRRAAEDAMEQLAFAGARVVGAVLNDPNAIVPSYGVYHYSYGYHAATK
jgi:capsular exopolysaccharide synthesis family protein